MTCELCGRTTAEGEDLCQYHALALKNLREGYDQWSNALEIGWDEYLEQVYDLDSSGLWVREVIEYLKSESGREEK
jgi:hypothetical protein